MLKKLIPLSMTVSRMLAKTPRYFYEGDKSMITNILSSFTIKEVTQSYKVIQPYAIPRTLSIASRKLAFFCQINDPTLFSDLFHELMRRFYANLFQIDPLMLSPEECYNFIYFFRASQRLWEYLQIDQQKINQTRDLLFNRVLMRFQNLHFNRYCDFLQQLKKINKMSQIRRPLDEARVYQMCEKAFPTDQEQKQIDSLYHLLQLYQNLVQQNPKSRPSTLYQKTCQKIIKLIQHVHLTPLIKIVNISIANFENRASNEKEKLFADAAFRSILKRICNILEGQESLVCLEVRIRLQEYIKDLQSQSCQIDQTLLGITLQINKLLKITKTPEQIAKQERAMQHLKQSEQQYQKYLRAKQAQQFAPPQEQSLVLQKLSQQNNQLAVPGQPSRNIKQTQPSKPSPSAGGADKQDIQRARKKRQQEISQKNRLQRID